MREVTELLNRRSKCKKRLRIVNSKNCKTVKCPPNEKIQTNNILQRSSNLHLDTLTLDAIVAEFDKSKPDWRYQNRNPMVIEDDASQRRVYEMNDTLGISCPKGRATIHKVDKKPATPTAEKLALRNYNTKNEVTVSTGLAIDDAVNHHVIPITDSYDIPVGDRVLKVSVEPKFENSMSLKRYLEAKAKIGQKGLSEEEFAMIGDIIDAAAYLKNRGILHRDINYKNVLVAPLSSDNSRLTNRPMRLESRLTDMATAKQIQDITDSTDPTIASQSLKDVRFRFAQNGQCYKSDEYSEMYSIGMLAIQAITGELPNISNVKNIYEYKVKVNEVLSLLPKWANRHKKWISKCLEPEVGKRHAGLEGLLWAYLDASKPNLTERIKGLSKKALIAIGTGLASAVLAAGIGAYELNKTQNELTTQKDIAKRYRVTSEWNGAPLEMHNNLVRLEVTAYKKDEWGKTYPKVKYLAVNPGEKIDVSVRAIENPWPKRDLACQPSFRCMTYLEGIPVSAESLVKNIKSTNGVISYYIDAESFNQGIPNDAGGPIPPEFYVKIPSKLKSGIYVLSTALYPPEKEDYGNVKYNVEPKFSSRTNAIALQRIPVVVGNVDQPFDISSFYVDGYSDSINFKFLKEYEPGIGQPLKEGTSIAFSSPEKNFLETISATSWSHFALPREHGETSYTFQMAHFDKTGNVDWYSAVPINREIYNKQYNVYSTKVNAPSLDFPKELIRYREQLEGQIKNFCATNYSVNAKTSR